MIDAVHLIVYSSRADAVRRFFQDVLGLEWVDAGGGWPIFALPPAELAVHPAEGPDRHELFLMCSDLDTTMDRLREKGVGVGEVTEQSWGRLTTVSIPDAGVIQLYQPNHPRPG